MNEQTNEMRSAQLDELRSRMDRALTQSARGEGSDGEEFMQAMLDELDSKYASAVPLSPRPPRKLRIRTLC